MEDLKEKPIRPSRRRQRGRWWIPLSIVLAVIVLFVLTIIGIFSYMVSSIENLGSKSEPKVITAKTVLKLDCGSLSEVNNTSGNSFTSMFNNTPTATFYEVIESIKYASTDPNIVGIYYDGSCYLSGAMLKEMQLALDEFKKSGKFIYSYLTLSDKMIYYMSLSSDSIFVPDEGMYEFSGFSVSNVFMKGLYDKIGIEYDVVQCEDFKTAAEPYKNTKFSDSSRLEYKILISQKENDFINSVAKYRNITNDEVIAIMSEGILDGDQMINYKLADKKASKLYVDNLLAEKTDTKNKKKDTTDTDKDSYNSISIDDYVYSIASKINVKSDDKIAIISGEGAIVDAAMPNNPFFGSGESSIVASDFVELIKEAKDDDKIKGIIIRVNSPGGSVIASEEIYQAIIDAKKVKPVYASMSDVAASGGYYISMACDTIIADSATVTGSIGVVAAFPNVSKVIKNLYMNIDTISNGIGNPYFLNSMLPRDAKNSAMFEKMIKNTYTRFINKAASSRKMSYDDLHKVAKGRVWLGKDAKEKGLVDVLGNFQVAIDMMKKRIAKEDKKVELVFMPKAEDPFKSFMKLFKKNNISTPFVMDSNAEFLMKSVIPTEYQKQVSYLILLSQITQKERMLVAMPELIEIK